MGRVEGCSRSVIQDCGSDQEGRKLSLETRVEEVGFEVLPKRCNRETVSYMKETVPLYHNFCVLTSNEMISTV